MSHDNVDRNCCGGIIHDLSEMGLGSILVIEVECFFMIHGRQTGEDRGDAGYGAGMEK